MERIKSIGLTLVGTTVALALLGFFASVGFAVIGALLVLGAIAALTATIASFVQRPNTEAVESPHVR